MRAGYVLGLAGVIGGAACAQIIGYEDARPGWTGGTGGSASVSSASSASSAVSSSSSTSGTGGHPVICDADAGMIACDDVCVDMETDKHNCGRCGHDCLHGACASGMCQAWPVAMNADVAVQNTALLYLSNQIGADASYVAWIDSAGVVHEALAGGGSVSDTIPGPSAKGVGVVVSQGTVAFLEMGSVYAAVEAGLTKKAQPNLPSGCAASALAFNPGASVVLLSGECTGSYPMISCKLPGTTCTLLNFQVGGAELLQVNGTYAFWASSSAISSYDFMTSAPPATVSTGAAEALAIDGTNVYWAAGGTSSAAFTVYALPQDFTSQTMPRVVTSTGTPSNSHPITGLAADGTNVYFGTLNLCGNASLYYAPISGGSPTMLYTSQWDTPLTAEGYVVAASGAVYWADITFTSAPPTSNIMGIAAP